LATSGARICIGIASYN